MSEQKNDLAIGFDRQQISVRLSQRSTPCYAPTCTQLQFFTLRTALQPLVNEGVLFYATFSDCLQNVFASGLAFMLQAPDLYPEICGQGSRK